MDTGCWSTTFGRVVSPVTARNWTSGHASWPRAGHADEVEALRARAAEGTVTILYAARDREHNNAAGLGELLRGD